jgi:dihydrofolate synthase/folylpolyglutamate synthase
VLTLTIPGEENAHPAPYIAAEGRKAGFDAKAYRALGPAIDVAAALGTARVVICGSLYLGGYVLDKNGTPPV